MAGLGPVLAADGDCFDAKPLIARVAKGDASAMEEAQLKLPCFQDEALADELAVAAGEFFDARPREYLDIVNRLMGELERVHSSNHRQRLAQFILLHASSDGTLRMTQQQLARLVGEFSERGMLRTQRGGLTIVDLFALRGVLVKRRAGD